MFERLDESPAARAWVQWARWMRDGDEESARQFVARLFARESVLFECGMGRIVPLVEQIALLRHKMGYESVYVWSHEWEMIDDPMHSISSHLPTWETSVHPLAELALLAGS